MRIVEATAEHINDICDLFEMYRKFYQKDPAPTEAKEFILSHLQKKTSLIYLTESNGVICGFVQLYPSFSSLAMKKMFILNDLYIHPDYRRMGLAKLLINHCESKAKELGARGLTLQTATDNTQAQELYLSLGWKKSTSFYTYTKILD